MRLWRRSYIIMQYRWPARVLLRLQRDEVFPCLLFEFALVDDCRVFRGRASGEENGEGKKGQILHRRTLGILWRVVQ